MKVEPDKVLAPTLVAAWFQSCKLLLRDGDRFNLVVHIADPTYLDEADLARFDPRRINSSAKSVCDVANTIFPDRTARWGNPWF
jgi:hypothetical protein